jgi:hypothetical protein
MIKVEGHELWRGGVKIGYVEDGHIIDHLGDRVGTFSSDHIYNKSGHALAKIDGDYIYFLDSSHKIRIEDNNKDVVGGSLNNIQKAAARVLLGE